MKKVMLCFTITIGVMIVFTAGTDSLKIQPERENSYQTGTNQPPHGFGSFQGPGAEFSGGNTVTNYNLSSVRRVSHPKLIRLVFVFTEGNSGKVAETPPSYVVKLEENSSRVTMRLKGVTKADIIKDKRHILSLSDLIKDITFSEEKDTITVLNIDIYRPVTFQVFDLGNPARIVVVLNTDDNQVNNKL